MTQRFRRALALSAALLVGSFASTAQAAADAPPAAQSSACDRACLESYVDRYLQAMASHKVDPELFAGNVRFTENGVQLPFGTEGLWATATGVGNYKFYVPDIETRQVAFLGTVQETVRNSPEGKPELVGIALRLRIDPDGKISEVEQVAGRPDRPLFGGAGAPKSPIPDAGPGFEAQGSPDPLLLAAIPEKERRSRAELIQTANYFFEAIQRATGKGYYPFPDDCVRKENGSTVAGPPGTMGVMGMPAMTCKGQLQTVLVGAVSTVRDRRFVAVDRERGVVFAFDFYDHRPINWTSQFGIIFKVQGDQITRSESIFVKAPYGGCSGWSTYEQCRSETIHDVR